MHKLLFLPPLLFHLINKFTTMFFPFILPAPYFSWFQYNCVLATSPRHPVPLMASLYLLYFDPCHALSHSSPNSPPSPRTTFLFHYISTSLFLRLILSPHNLTILISPLPFPLPLWFSPLPIFPLPLPSPLFHTPASSPLSPLFPLLYPLSTYLPDDVTAVPLHIYSTQFSSFNQTLMSDLCCTARSNHLITT